VLVVLAAAALRGTQPPPETTTAAVQPQRETASAAVQPPLPDVPVLPPAPPVRIERADFGELAPSVEARGVADWIVRSGDHGGQPFLIIDKVAASIYVFGREGRAYAAAPVLLGIAAGDRFEPGSAEKDMYATRVSERITPAGRFVGQAGMDDKGHRVVWIDYDAGIAMHAVLDVPGQRRRERLTTATANDNRISFGCVNLPTELFLNVVRPLFDRARAVVYVLPETGSALELFAGTCGSAKPGCPSVSGRPG
jgi:hypothetical protein